MRSDNFFLISDFLVPTSLTVPESTASTLSVVSLATNTGLAKAGATLESLHYL